MYFANNVLKIGKQSLLNALYAQARLLLLESVTKFKSW